MTIKARNRINLFFFILATFILVLEASVFLYNLVKGNLIIEKASVFKPSPVFAFCGIFALGIYVSAISLITLRTFEKTHSEEVVFFLIFLAACLIDTFRLYIPLFILQDTYTRALFVIGNTSLFAKLLAPLALLSMNILCDEEHRKDLERNCVVVIISVIFITSFLPLNTLHILPNFTLSFSHHKIITTTTFLMLSANIFTNAIICKRNGKSQIMTLGLIALCAGYTCLFNCTTLLNLIIGTITLTGGSLVYLKELHNLCAWDD